MNIRAALLTALAIAAPALAQGGPPAAKVRVDNARMETLDRQRNVTGELVAARRSNVAAKASGLVLEMDVNVGDTITQNDVIARLDDTLARIEVQRRDAEVASAEALIRERRAMVAQTERDLERLNELGQRNGASRSEIDDAETDLEAASAQLARAKADLAIAKAERARAEQELADLTIRAPFTGAVVRRDIELGQWIDEGDTALELIELDRVDVYIDVPEAFIGPLSSMNRPIELSFAGGAITRSAPYTAIIDDADPEARTFPVRVRLDNADHRLRPGMSVTGLVPTGELTEQLTVHKDAILRDDAGAYVYFVADGKALPARITPLYAVGTRTVVKAPQLTPGTPLIIEGNERLYPTQAVEVVGGEVTHSAATANAQPRGD